MRESTLPFSLASSFFNWSKPKWFSDNNKMFVLVSDIFVIE